MNDSLKRVHAANVYKLWDAGDFTSGNSYSVTETVEIVPAGTRCVLRSFVANSVIDSNQSVPSLLKINNAQSGARVAFQDGAGSVIFVVKAEAAFGTGLLSWGRNELGLVCNIPCNGVLFDNGMSVRIFAATGTESAPAAPAGPYGINVNILYGG
jgi:hypothetical protein